ncbi:MAG: hypothetical protein E7642_06475 [Ruminococcaceae bacterium]|nr:hypothetical protein [Oscillospiraceae bacterium]
MKNYHKNLVAFILAILMLGATACKTPISDSEDIATSTLDDTADTEKSTTGGTSMNNNRRNQLLEIVSEVTQDKKVSKKFASYLEELLDVVDPKVVGEAFGKALENNDYSTAIKECAAYFRAKPDFDSKTGFSAKGSYDTWSADNCVNGTFTVVGVKWTFDGGKVDFLFNPTSINGPLNNEWVYQFNRHQYWNNLARTYVGTGNEKYAKAFRDQMLTWLTQTDVTSRDSWRTIECGLRLSGPWLVAFDGFKKSASLDDLTLLLMVASMHRQASHMTKNYSSGNWLMMELNGVFSFSAMFTELSDSNANRENVESRIVSDVSAQVLPDGMQYELSPDYHWVTLVNALNFCSLSRNLGYGVDDELVVIIKDMINAAILLSTPAFTQPNTNDTYTLNTSMFLQKSALEILGTLSEYSYILSNRAEGEAPTGDTASAFLSYAGFAAMRSDWGADAAYMCFDVGPLGAAHIHQDMLNIILFKGDQQLIYDDGGGQYDQSEYRDYAVSGYAHNTVLVDALAQTREEPKSVSEPIDAGWITNDVFDYATATYDSSFGGKKSATHKREVRFCKPGFFIVADTLTSVDGNAHDYELLFHLDTTQVKELDEYQNGVMSEYGDTYEIVIIPLDQDPSSVELNCISGSTDPIKGWYNGRNDEVLHEAMTVSRTVSDVEDFKFTTLLFPVKSGDALPTVTQNDDGEITVNFEGQTYVVDIDNLNE